MNALIFGNKEQLTAKVWAELQSIGVKAGAIIPSCEDDLEAGELIACAGCDAVVVLPGEPSSVVKQAARDCSKPFYSFVNIAGLTSVVTHL